MSVSVVGEKNLRIQIFKILNVVYKQIILNSSYKYLSTIAIGSFPVDPFILSLGPFS